MCTGFVKKGKDLIFGFNMDINVGAFSWDVYPREDCFYIGIQAGENVPNGGELPAYYELEENIRKTMGVNASGVVSVMLNNLNFSKAPFTPAEGKLSLDQVSDDLISGKREVSEVMELAGKGQIVNIPVNSVEIPDLGMHALIVDRDGTVNIIEPGNGCSRISENYAVLSNFALLELPSDLTEKAGYYGLDRYNKALGMLRESEDDFSVPDAFGILKNVRQEGVYATRVSFVYSRNEGAVYYVIERDFSHVKKHVFKK